LRASVVVVVGVIVILDWRARCTGLRRWGLAHGRLWGLGDRRRRLPRLGRRFRPCGGRWGRGGGRRYRARIELDERDDIWVRGGEGARRHERGYRGCRDGQDGQADHEAAIQDAPS
jgi:hypothetical protein